MKNILKKAKNKYKVLERNISLDSLCGNRFWKNEITVNKYLAGMVILANMRERIYRRNLQLTVREMQERTKKMEAEINKIKEKSSWLHIFASAVGTKHEDIRFDPEADPLFASVLKEKKKNVVVPNEPIIVQANLLGSAANLEDVEVIV